MVVALTGYLIVRKLIHILIGTYHFAMFVECTGKASGTPLPHTLSENRRLGFAVVTQLVLLLAMLSAQVPLYGQPAQSPQRSAAVVNLPPLRQVDDNRARAAGVRKLESKHLVLYTDVPSSPAIDELPAVFDLAVPQWAEYFAIPQEKYRNWRAQGFLIRNRETFEALGLMPGIHNDFPNGISVGRDFWFYAQPSDYYTRHLMLHEGTHVFTLSFLGGCGPGWYMEGVAELFGTHRYDGRYKQLTMRTMPQNRDEVPMWGRTKLIESTAERERSLVSVMETDNSRLMSTSQYAWCWALAKFLDTHPRYSAQFRKLQNLATDPNFNTRVQEAYRDQWNDLQAEWLAYIAALDYGYNFDRMAIDFSATKPVAIPERATIQADRGWQSTGLRLETGKSYNLAAKGRYVIANDGAPWPCEPGGVTIEYHDGRPLGMLLGAIAGNKAGTTLASPFEIGSGSIITPKASGTLFLRVNDSAAKLDDNRGSLSVVITPQ